MDNIKARDWNESLQAGSRQAESGIFLGMFA